MAPCSKSEKDNNKTKTQRKHKGHVVKLLVRGQLSGQFSQRLFRKLPPRVCVPLKNIVSEEFLRAGHIFLGFTKCGRYVLSYNSDCGEDDDFSFYTYHLYWWEFNLHSRLKQVHHVQLFAGEEIYSDLYLTVCEWPNDHSKIVIFGFNTRSSNSVLMNLMMGDENNRDIYITIASMPPPKHCSQCSPIPSCLEHGYVLNSRYQVVYPFPTFQPAFQLKKDQVILLNTSYSLVACAISLCPGKQAQSSRILYTKKAAQSTQPSTSTASTSPASSSLPQGSPRNLQLPSWPAPTPPLPNNSQDAMRAREFAAELFRRAQGGGVGKGSVGQVERQTADGDERKAVHKQQDKKINVQPPSESVCVEQLTLDFEYLINEVIRNDVVWAPQFCSFSDYDVVILEVCSDTNIVMINIGLLLLAFSISDEERCRPNTYHTNLQVSWDLNTGVCCTVGVGDLTEVKGQTSGSVWSSYRKSCVNTVMKWLIPESSSRYIHRMTNDALHKGSL
uniref:DDB1 and CUL4 associated factor 15 n=1 Tax=Nothobranchius furzeri TaxID=105023 RepID=A0A8C6LJF0_NOTFU